MRCGCVFLFAALLAAAQGMLIKDGMEYDFKYALRLGAGTMDHAPHSAGTGAIGKLRLQRNGQTFNVEMEKPQVTQYVGPMNAFNEPDTDLLKFTEMMGGPDKIAFSVNINDDGVFKSLAMPDVPIAYQNWIKGWASVFQVNTARIKKGERQFTSTESTIHGLCEVSYTVTPDAIFKTVNHNDCKDRAARRVDDFYGYKCNKEESMDGLTSHSQTYYELEKVGSDYKITKVNMLGVIVSQMYETEGVSHMITANATFTLTGERSSSGDISGGNLLTNSLRYEFDDSVYGWDKSRDLKAAENLLSSGLAADMDQATLKSKIMGHMKDFYDLIHATGKDTVDEAHKHGINSIQEMMVFLDYDSLKSMADELMGDKSEKGIMVWNLFTESLGSTGTGPSAMLVLNLIKAKKFDNDRDAARVLTSVPFHLRRPNKQLVEEYSQLLDKDAPKFVKMAIPLAFGHLVHKTCLRADHIPYGENMKECVKALNPKWVKYFKDKLDSSDDREEKNMAIAALGNIKYGGIFDALEDIIKGKTDDSDETRTSAMWISIYDVLYPKKRAVEIYMPIFANRKESSEVRMTALSVVLASRPGATEFAKIVNVMRSGETDYELKNFVFANFEKLASSIDPCDEKTKELAASFLKYMKQFSKYETNWGFGVSKTYQRQYIKNKYGYGGSYTFYTMGTEDSMTPIKIGMAVSSTLHHSYKSNLFSVHLRIEGMAKGLIRKFKTMDPSIWKTADLQNILQNEMGIRAVPNQPVRVGATIMWKGIVVMQRTYSDNDADGDGKVGSFMQNLMSMGDEYSINHLRAIKVGSILYEQPTEIGIPMVMQGSIVTSGHIKANLKRGQHRGLMYVNIDYHINLFSQARKSMSIVSIGRNKVYSIVQDRIYKANIPRKLVLGVNVMRKELKFSASRPEFDNPWQLLMHSRTTVMTFTTKGLSGDLQENCPSCKPFVVLSAGEHAVKNRVFLDKEIKKRGVYMHGEYFDCEMKVDRRYTYGKIAAALMPYNKNPRNFVTGITMGIRQIRAFLIHFPRAEKCGAMLSYSQSKEDPVRQVEISIHGKGESNGARMFMRGRKSEITAVIKGKGDATRAWKISLMIETTPGNINNKFKLQIARAEVASLDIKPYVFCMAYANKYPRFSQEFMGVDMSKDISMSGKLMIQHGVGTECSDRDGEIRATFKYSTTQQGRDDLKNKWYYKECMKTKNSPGWSGLPPTSMPISEACFATAWDATNARKAEYKIEFVKLTDKTKKFIATVKSMVETGLLPYWDVDPDEMQANGDVGPFLNLDCELHDDDRLADITIETRYGTRTINDYALRLPWHKRLRNLKFSAMPKRLMNMGVISPCVATSKDIRTNDNVTYAYEASDCWTLTSAHCGEDPSYAVFTKKGSSSPLVMMAYIGGHQVEIDPSSGVSVDGNAISLTDGEGHSHTEGDVELMTLMKWGSSYHIYSFLRVWIVFDGNFVQVVPAPSVKGVHCGMCGNWNRNAFDEWRGKDGTTKITSASAMVDEWKWKC